MQVIGIMGNEEHLPRLHIRIDGRVCLLTTCRQTLLGWGHLPGHIDALVPAFVVCVSCHRMPFLTSNHGPIFCGRLHSIESSTVD